MSITIITQVYQTNDYNLFKTLQGNRVLNKINIGRLKDSFKHKYLLSPIIVNQNYEIIDGQHRFNAAKEQNLPINFIIVNDYGIEEVQLLNTNTANWKKEDYLQSFCDSGYPEYLKMKQFMIDYPSFGIAVSEQILTNTSNGVNNRGSVKNNGKVIGRKKNFQEGELTIPDLTLSYENAEKIMMFKPYYDGFNRTTFISAIIGLFKNPNYNHNQMISKLSKNPSSLVHCASALQYRALLEDIYNFRSREKVSLRF